MQKPDVMKLLIALAVFVCAGGFFVLRSGDAEEASTNADGPAASEAADVFEPIPEKTMKSKPPSARINEDIG